VNRHVRDQAHCVFDSEGRWMVDFWGTSENFQADWETVVREINGRMNTNKTAAQVPVVNKQGVYKSGILPDPLTAEPCSLDRYQHIDAAAARGIGLQYSMDAVRFGYLPPAISSQAERR
jgi:hypothetical protein